MSDTLPVPDLSPFALVHKLPDHGQHVEDQVAVAQSGVSPDRSHGVLDLGSLGGRVAGTANDEARYQQQGLNGIAGLERLQNGQGLIHRNRDTAVVAGRVPNWLWRIDSVRRRCLV
ncbi:uncharacterized protein PG998_014424 [Apiospora kogelbergensis]|uniref:uncharacterized protein n=1 Tax=Apiospora kogelbergensis TaxID=1337665 RepID=UPI00312CD026